MALQSFQQLVIHPITEMPQPKADAEKLALTTSGGGLRSLLSGAGVVQGLDSRDSNVSTSGLYEALTYQTGLSGGSWMLSSLAGNNYPTITQLKENIWKMAFQNSLLTPHSFCLLSPISTLLPISGERQLLVSRPHLLTHGEDFYPIRF